MLIVITGPDGSGKTTTCKMVACALRNVFGENSIADISPWDAASSLFASRARAERYMNSLDGAARGLFILSGILSAYRLAKQNDPRIIIFDSFWYKYVVSEIGLGASKEWLFNVVDIFPKPDLVFYLDVSPREAIMRKDHITPYERGYASGADAFIHFQTKLQPIWKQVESHTGSWQHINGHISRHLVIQYIFDECMKKVA